MYKKKEKEKERKTIRKINTGICGCCKCYFPLPNPHSKPTRCPIGPMMLVIPELLFNFWEVLFFSPQGFGQRPGAAGRLQVLGFVGAVAALLLIRIDVNAVQASEEQHQSQDDND